MTLSTLRIGQGYDLHRLVAGKPLRIGGVDIESPVGSEAHSDGDVLLHALIDALLGAVGLGDIGEHFPPSDPRYENADSQDLLSRVLEKIRDHAPGFQIMNVDSTVFLEAPALKPHKPLICECVAALLSLDAQAVSIKAKTFEKLGPIGQGKAVAASVTVLVSV